MDSFNISINSHVNIKKEIPQKTLKKFRYTTLNNMEYIKKSRNYSKKGTEIEYNKKSRKNIRNRTIFNTVISKEFLQLKSFKKIDDLELEKVEDFKKDNYSYNLNKKGKIEVVHDNNDLKKFLNKRNINSLNVDGVKNLLSRRSIITPTKERKNIKEIENIKLTDYLKNNFTLSKTTEKSREICNKNRCKIKFYFNNNLKKRNINFFQSKIIKKKSKNSILNDNLFSLNKTKENNLYNKLSIINNSNNSNFNSNKKKYKNQNIIKRKKNLNNWFLQKKNEFLEKNKILKLKIEEKLKKEFKIKKEYKNNFKINKTEF